MDDLSTDNIYDIFSRLPLKPLMRFQCVSKLWCNYIQDSHLQTLHAKRALKDPMLLMFHRFFNSPSTLSFVESSKESSGTVSDQPLQIVTKNPWIMDFSCTCNGFHRFSEIVLGSCNGLLYSSLCPNHDGTTFVVIHPLKKECYELPPIKTAFYPYGWSGLGFDDSTKTFKMVCVMMRQHVKQQDFFVRREDLRIMVYVLGVDSWREITQVPSLPIMGEGVFANGYLYWLARNDKSKLIWFDLRKEEFGSTNLPELQGSLCAFTQHLVDLDGEIGCVFRNFPMTTSVEVWVLKKKEWVMHCEFDPKPAGYCGEFTRVLGFWNKEGDILVTNNERKKLFVYSLKSGQLDEVNLIGQEYGSATTDIRIYQSSLFTSSYSIKKN